MYSENNFNKQYWIFSGDITQKGYEKKKSRILAPYIPKQNLGKSVFQIPSNFLV